MRLDKFLKVSRIIKRRTLAKEVCDSGKIMINQRIAKASSNITVDDVIEIDFGHRLLKVKVLQTPNAISAKEAKEIFEVLDDFKKPML